MTLPDDRIIVGLGEVLWDCFDDARHVGGAPANVAFHAQALGNHGLVCSRVGDDDLGRDLLEFLATRGLDTQFVQTDPAHPTGRVTVDTTDPERPAYTIHENTAWDALEYTDQLAALMPRAAAVCFGTLAQRDPRTRATIHRALQDAHRALTVYDVNLRQHWYERDWIERSLQASRVVKLNDAEYLTLTDVLDLNANSPELFAQAIQRRFNVELVCVTKAEHGCLLVSRDEVVNMPSRPVQVVDAVGAGDAFCAALITGLLHRWPLPRVAEFANHIGGLVAARAGAMSLRPAEGAALIAEMESRATDPQTLQAARPETTSAAIDPRSGARGPAGD